MPTRFSTKPACRTGLNLLKDLKQRLTKKISFGKLNNAPVSKPPSEPKITTQIFNLKRALQSSPELGHKKSMSSISGSTLSSKFPSHMCSPLESSQRSSGTSLTSLGQGSTTTVVFEPARVKRPFIFPLRNAPEVTFQIPLRKARSLCENMLQSPPLLPTITLTTPDDDSSYALSCPRSLELDTSRLGVPIRVARSWPHPAGPWLRTMGETYPKDPTDIFRLSNDTLVGYSAARIPPPRLLTDAQREARVVVEQIVEQIQVDLEDAQQEFNSRFDGSWVNNEFSKDIEDDEDVDDDDDEEEEFLFWNNHASALRRALLPTTSHDEDYEVETIEIVE